MEDKRFRQALQYAINCEEIVKQIQMGYGQCAVVGVPLGAAGVPADLKPYPYDPAKAKQLLKEAGMEGAAFTYYIRLPGRWSFESETHQAISGYWTAIGLKPALQVVESTAYIAWSKISVGLPPEVKEPPKATLPMYAVEVSAGVMDTASILVPYGTCRGAYSLYCNPAMDALFQKALAAAGEERIRLTEQAVRMWYDEVPIINLFTLNFVTGMTKDLEYPTAPNGEFILNNIRRVR